MLGEPAPLPKRLKVIPRGLRPTRFPGVRGVVMRDPRSGETVFTGDLEGPIARFVDGWLTNDRRPPLKSTSAPTVVLRLVLFLTAPIWKVAFWVFGICAFFLAIVEAAVLNVPGGLVDGAKRNLLPPVRNVAREIRHGG